VRRRPPGRPRSPRTELSANSDLKQGRDSNGREIWIEEVDEYTGKPKIWYSLDSRGRKQKHVRDANGISISREEE
jgi:hypothetical protein